MILRKRFRITRFSNRYSVDSLYLKYEPEPLDLFHTWRLGGILPFSFLTDRDSTTCGVVFRSIAALRLSYSESVDLHAGGLRTSVLAAKKKHDNIDAGMDHECGNYRFSRISQITQNYS